MSSQEEKNTQKEEQMQFMLFPRPADTWKTLLPYIKTFVTIDGKNA